MKKRAVITGMICMALAGCGGYRVLRVEVLKPAALALPVEGVILFADRGIVHEGDTLHAGELEEILGVTRDDLVEHLFLGLQEGLQRGEGERTVERTGERERSLVADSVVPPPLAPDEARAIAGEGKAAYLLTVDYCKFRRDRGNRVELDDNTLVRVYDAASGALLDTLTSGRLAATERLTAEDYSGSIRAFFYQKGWSLAGYLAPAWVPEERRIYTGRGLLDLGAYLLDNGHEARAMETWRAALRRGTSRAARAAVNVAWLLEREGEFEEAARLLDATLERAEGARVRASLLAYIRSRAAALKQRHEDSEQLTNQLNNIPHGEF
ncbi:MAG: hypothetical protein LBP56_03460 [Odoribacteraceae bacterium]|jgi:tetratricopeptide (TPR) repeat protein|nr:hypothetical protein [Odoribacteraceae bacterium]